MIVTPIKTNRVEAGSISLAELLDTYLTRVSEGDIVAITSKLVSICENRVKPLDISKDTLIQQEAAYYLPDTESKYGHRFTITQNTLIAGAGIDESNADNQYVLWPADPQQTANEIRIYLKDKFNLNNVGVIITDSTCTPLRLGTVGIVLTHSGFKALHNYVGELDLYGKSLKVTQSNIAGGLAASAVVTMGEGNEQTPIALISDVPFVAFQDLNPTQEELAELVIAKEDDLFAPFLEKTDWLKGQGR